MISFFKNSNNFYAIDHKKKFQEDDIIEVYEIREVKRKLELN